MSEWPPAPLLIPFHSNTKSTYCKCGVTNELLCLCPSPLWIFEAKTSSCWLWTLTIFVQVLSVHHDLTLHTQTQFIINLALNEICWSNLLMTLTVTPTCSPHLSGKHSLMLVYWNFQEPSLLPYQIYCCECPSSILHSSNTNAEVSWVCSMFCISGNFI